MITPDTMGPQDGGRRQCTARAKRTGERCQRRPIKGGNVCISHGGKAQQVRAAAERRRQAAKVEADVRDAIAFRSTDGVRDPLAALAELADEALAMKEVLAGRVNSLRSIRYSAPGSGTEQLRAEVALYERAMDRAAKFLDLLARSGFEERRVRVSEETGQMVAGALRLVLARMLGAVVEELGSADVPAAVVGRVERRWGDAMGVVVPEELRRLNDREASK